MLNHGGQGLLHTLIRHGSEWTKVIPDFTDAILAINSLQDFRFIENQTSEGAVATDLQTFNSIFPSWNKGEKDGMGIFKQ